MFGFKPGASAKDEKKPAPRGADQAEKPQAPKEPEKRKHQITDYTGGGSTRRRMEAMGLKDGGPVRGPGTGTSDDIETVVPEGSYIMPADSTEQIGEQSLAGMGSPVPVNLSNGEYQLPPEQVHAVGVQALNQMKDATHTPTNKGFVPNAQSEAGKPELFFADGGVVDDERKKRESGGATGSWGEPQAPAAGMSAPSPLAPQGPAMPTVAQQYGQGFTPARQPQAAEPTVAGAFGDGMTGMLKTAAGALALPHSAAYDGARNTLGRMAGGDTGQIKQYTPDATGLAREGMQQMSGAAQSLRDQASTGVRSMLGIDKAPAPAAQPAAAAPVAQANPYASPEFSDWANAQQAPAAAPAIATSNQAGTPAQLPATGTAPAHQEGLANNVIRDGNSFSATGPISSGFTVNGGQFQPSGVGRSPQNEAAVQALFARTPELGEGTPQAPAQATGFQPGGIRVSGIGGAPDPRMSKAFAAASTAHPGAQNGQLTAAQLGAMRGLIGDERSDATSRANTESSNATAMQREAMSQTGANYRSTLQEGGQNARFGAANQLDQQRLAGEQEAQGFQTRAAQRTEKLYEQYDKAAPEDRAAIAEQIRTLSGKDQAPRFGVAAGGQAFNADGTAYTVPSMIYNQQTGEVVQQPGAQPAKSGGIPSPTSKAEYDALPKGAQYMKDGQLRVKN